MWYVDASVYGITCTFGRLRPLRNTFCFTPSVRMSTFCSATSESRRASADQARGLRRVVVERVDHEDRVLARARIERALACERLHLARHVLVVVARRRTEHRTTADPVRSARRALTCATRALLLPRLLVAADDDVADLRRRGALALVGENAFTAWCITGMLIVPSNSRRGQRDRRRARVPRAVNAAAVREWSVVCSAMA